MVGNLNVVIGRIKFTSSSDRSDLTIIIIIAVISTALSILLLIIIVIAFKHLKRHCHFTTKSKSFTNEPVNMYASPAYGTHQVFSEPGLDHLYERIDDSEIHKESTLQDPAVGDDEVDVDGHLKMKSSCKIDQTVTKGSVRDIGTHPGFGELTQNVPLASNNITESDNQKAIQPQDDDDSTLHSDYENEDDENASQCAAYLQVFNERVDKNQLKFTGNVTL